MKTKTLITISLIFIATITYGQWSKVLQYNKAPNLIGLTSIDSLIILGTVDSIMVSKNDGMNWDRIDTLKAAHYSSFSVHNNIIVISGGRKFGDINVTSDYGKNWNAINYSMHYPVYEVFANENNYMVRSIYETAYSSDGGSNWNYISLYDVASNPECNSPHCEWIGTIAHLLAQNGSSLYVDFNAATVKDGSILSSTTKGLHVSSDGGRNWAKLGILADQIDFNLPNIFVKNSSGLYSSSDNGNKWKLKLQRDLIFFKALHDTIIGIDSTNIYISYNNGDDWKTTANDVYSKVFGNASISYTINSSYIYIYADSALYRKPLKSLNLSPLNINAETKGMLDIFPNPSDKSILIKADIVNKVLIYNLMGELILSESHSNTIDLSELKSGVYVVKINYDNTKFAVQKIIKK